MIRIRRTRSRLPFSRVYKIELSPRGMADLTRHYITRSPNSVLEPLLGVGDAWSFVGEADRQWKDGNSGWAVECEEDPES
jgi:hypothetical protein